MEYPSSNVSILNHDIFHDNKQEYHYKLERHPHHNTQGRRIELVETISQLIQ
jgi:hypothetical protein